MFHQKTSRGGREAMFHQKTSRGGREAMFHQKTSRMAVAKRCFGD